MEIHEFFWVFAFILVSAKMLGQVFAGIGIPAVLGELAAGFILGPSLLGIIHPNETLQILAEIGIVLLIFEVGQETDILQMKEVGFNAVVVAVVGALLPFLLGYAVSRYLFDYSLLISLFIGGMLTATSIGITVRVLKDIQRDQSLFAQVVIGAAVLDDILGVTFLVVVYDFAVTGTVSIMRTAKVLVLMVVFLVAAPIIALLFSKMIQIVENMLSPSGFLAPTYVALLLVLAYLSHALGVSVILGAFAAGIAMSRRFIVPICERCNLDRGFITKVETCMKPIVVLFTPVFFVMIGLNIDLRILDFTSINLWIIGTTITTIAVVAKMAGGFLTKGMSLLERTLTGVSMVPRGEVGLVFANLGLVQGVLTKDIFATLIFVIVLTTLLPPFALKWLCRYDVRTQTPKTEEV
jgi:Kef-type K+ transport system membrane component KefB